MSDCEPLPQADQDAARSADPPCVFRIPRVSTLLIVAVVGLIVTVLINLGVPHWRKLRLLNMVESLGGDVQTEYRGPEWLRGVVGDADRDLFNVVLEIHVDDDRVGDRFVALAADQPDLRTLSVGGSYITGAGLAQLGHARKLQQLAIIYSGLTDQALESLPDWPELQELHLAGNPITGPGLQHLDRVPQLKKLDLLDCRVTDEGLWQISLAAPQLERLELGMTDISNAGLRHLERLEHLKELDLYATAVNDDAVAMISRIRSLRSVGLSHTNLTDDGVQELTDNCPDLQTIWIWTRDKSIHRHGFERWR